MIVMKRNYAIYHLGNQIPVNKYRNCHYKKRNSNRFTFYGELFAEKPPSSFHRERKIAIVVEEKNTIRSSFFPKMLEILQRNAQSFSWKTSNHQPNKNNALPTIDICEGEENQRNCFPVDGTECKQIVQPSYVILNGH